MQGDRIFCWAGELAFFPWRLFLTLVLFRPLSAAGAGTDMAAQVLVSKGPWCIDRSPARWLDCSSYRGDRPSKRRLRWWWLWGLTHFSIIFQDDAVLLVKRETLQWIVWTWGTCGHQQPNMKYSDVFSNKLLQNYTETFFFFLPKLNPSIHFYTYFTRFRVAD